MASSISTRPDREKPSRCSYRSLALWLSLAFLLLALLCALIIVAEPATPAFALAWLARP